MPFKSNKLLKSYLNQKNQIPLGENEILKKFKSNNNNNNDDNIGGSEYAINIVGKAMIYSGNNFSSSSCIPCGNYCSDFN